jgi:hypothetical protein
MGWGIDHELSCMYIAITERGVSQYEHEYTKDTRRLPRGCQFQAR